jgi:hypothetical protein
MPLNLLKKIASNMSSALLRQTTRLLPCLKRLVENQVGLFQKNKNPFATILKKKKHYKHLVKLIAFNNQKIGFKTPAINLKLKFFSGLNLSFQASLRRKTPWINFYHQKKLVDTEITRFHGRNRS